MATAKARAMRIPYNINHGIISPRLHWRSPFKANRSVIKATGEKIDMKTPKRKNNNSSPFAYTYKQTKNVGNLLSSDLNEVYLA